MIYWVVEKNFRYFRKYFFPTFLIQKKKSEYSILVIISYFSLSLQLLKHLASVNQKTHELNLSILRIGKNQKGKNALRLDKNRKTVVPNLKWFVSVSSPPHRHCCYHYCSKLCQAQSCVVIVF